MRGVWKRTVLATAVAGVVLTTGCKGTIGDFNTTGPVPDVCNSAQDALTNANCYLTLGQWKQEYISEPKDQDWFSVDVGAVDSRSVVHVVAGYFPPDAGSDGGAIPFNTAVNLSVNVLLQDGLTSESAAKDVHGTAPPKPLDLTFHYDTPNTRLIVLLSDDDGKKFDNKQPYSVKVEVVPDPDVNEPNDGPPNGNPTVVPLTSANGGFIGQGSGYLSTPNDKDLFSVTAPAGNYVMYIGLSQDPTVPAPPPHRYRLQYYLYDPTGAQVAEGDAPPGSQFSANLVSIANAQLLKMSGTYTIDVQGYRDTQTVGDVPGDLAFKYLLTVIIVPLQDPTEGAASPFNNNFASAFPVSSGLGVGGTASVTGRTSYSGDEDWYSFTVLPSASPTLLHYKLTPGTGPARFPELPTKPVRQLSVYTTPAATAAACLNQDAGVVCPITGSVGSVGQSLAISACGETPPKCLESYRAEPLAVGGNQAYPNLRNFEAVLQVPPGGSAVTYYFRLQPLGDLTQNQGYWADDKDYVLTVDHLAEPDPAEMVPDPPRPATLGASLALTGYLSYGPGQLKDPKPATPIVADDDYDGRGDDLDSYTIALPITGVDTTWALSYSVPVGAGSDPAYDLGFTLQFCDNSPDAGTGTPPCYAVVTRPKFTNEQLGLFYTDDTLAGWWNNSNESPGNTIPLEMVYDRQVVGSNVVTTVRPYGCFCFEQRFLSLAGSYFVMNVFPVNRTSWNLVPYNITMGTSAYPYSFTPNGGGSHTCPSPCHFTYY